MERVHTVVVGAGFGGLSAALHLARAGHRVVVCEALTYAGGCASTYSKGEARYEAGATLLSGFGPGQWMRGWLDAFDLDVTVDPVEPAFTFHGPAVVPVTSDRRAFADALAVASGVDPEPLRRWFRYQERIGDVLWGVLDDPSLLPPLSVFSLVRHAVRLPRYLRLLPLVNRSLESVLQRHGVAEVPALRAFLDAACQITVQVPSAEAEATFAIGAVDNFFRGVAHVHGGVGELARACCDAVERMGGEVRLANRVKGLTREGRGWRLRTRQGEVWADNVVANLLPQDLMALAGVRTRRLERMSARVSGGWGAAMLYMLVRDEGLPAHAVHHELVADASRPLPGGNHVLVSITARDPSRAPAGLRAVSASTHVDPLSDDPATEMASVQRRMRETLGSKLPQLRIVHEHTASPRTFERFTRRSDGLVGGVPRRVGWGNYAGLWPRPVAPGLWLVGDSVFPGQSVLATAIGGARVARAIGPPRRQALA